MLKYQAYGTIWETMKLENLQSQEGNSQSKKKLWNVFILCLYRANVHRPTFQSNIDVLEK